MQVSAKQVIALGWSSWGAGCTVTESKQLSFTANQEGAYWPGCGSWIGTDASSYDYLVVKVSTITGAIGDVNFNAILYTDKNAGISSSTYNITSSDTEIKINLNEESIKDYKNQLRQINAQCNSETGSTASVTIESMTLMTEAEYLEAYYLEKDITTETNLSQWNSGSYDTTKKTFTVGGNWSGFGWYIGEPYWDWSDYTKMIVEFDEAIGYDIQCVVTYTATYKDGDADKNYTSSQTATAGSRYCVINLNGTYKNGVKQFHFGYPYEKGESSPTFKFKRVYLVSDKYIVLDKDIAYIPTATNAYVQLYRPLKAGWNTICLPFATNVSSIAATAQLYEFTAATANTITLTKKDNGEMAANTPYFVKLSAAISTPIVFSNVDVVTPSAGSVEYNGLTFNGNYEVAMSMVDKYGVANGAIKKGVTGSTLPAFSAYFDSTTYGAREFSIFTEDETTGISSMQAEPAKMFDNQYYNLNGQRISQPAKGLYIKNGKKYIVK